MIREGVIQCLENLGVYVDDAGNNFNVMNYIENSIVFVNLIIEIEQMFEIEIPDTYLNPENIGFIDQLVEVVKELSSGRALPELPEGSMA